MIETLIKFLELRHSCSRRTAEIGEKAPAKQYFSSIYKRCFANILLAVDFLIFNVLIHLSIKTVVKATFPQIQIKIIFISLVCELCNVFLLKCVVKTISAIRKHQKELKYLGYMQLILNVNVDG